jgi:hypothetical protein
MPHATLKFLPGVDENRTMALNESSLSYTQLVRFVPDKQGLGLVQKLGGWTRFFPSSVGSTVRALWGWQDTNEETHLALGSENRIAITTATSGTGSTITLTHDGTITFNVGDTVYVSGVTPTGYNGTYTLTAVTATTVSYAGTTTGSMQIAGTIAAGDALSEITNGQRTILTPRTATFDVTPNFTTTIGSSQVLVQVNSSYVDSYDSVYIKTPISVDGLILFGLYRTTYVDGLNLFYITATDVEGNPQLATSNVTSGGAVPVFNFTDTQAYTDVTLNNNGYAVGDTFTVLIPLHAGAVTVYGNYTVSQINSVNSFRISLGTAASKATVISANYAAGTANIIYSGDYNFVVGNSVTVASITSTGPGSYNGSFTVSSAGNQANVTSASWTGGTATLVFTNSPGEPRTFTVGETIIVAGVVPSGYNGTFTVTSANASQVSYTVSNPGAYTSGGLIYGRVSYTLGTTGGTYTSGGTVFNASAAMNGGNAEIVDYNTPGPLPEGTGYGVGGYGLGGYGTGIVPPTSALAGNPISATDWTLDNWGQILVAGDVGGPIYTWDPTSNTDRASIITEAPPINDGCFVAMPQQQIIAWGSTFTGIQDPLLIRWCDVGNYNSWTASVVNQAGSYRLPKGSKIVSCIQGPQQGLVWTDLGIWAMQYVGPPYVYQFNELGNGCGLISRKAAASMNGVVYWMGQSQFFKLGGSGVEPIRCPIWDVIFQDLDTDNLSKIRIAPNSRFGEISWYYPTKSNGGEINAYVKYNILLDVWDFGSLTRTAWINESVLGPPIGAGFTQSSQSQKLIYQHETSPDADGSAMTSSFQTGYIVLTEGEWKMFVDQVWPDMKWGYYGGSQDADLNLTFYVTDYPHADPIPYGPFAFNNTTDTITPRFRARLVSIKMESNDAGSFWRIGATRYRFQQDGKF